MQAIMWGILLKITHGFNLQKATVLVYNKKE